MQINLADERLTGEQRKELAEKLRNSSEKSPSTQHSSEAYKFYVEQVAQMGTPYDVRHIPISVLEQMEHDPMISFGFHFVRTPIIRARWHIESESAQVSAFVDNALRRILPDYIRAYSRSWNYGFSPVVKRFQLEKPDWTYIDEAKSDEALKVWDNGNIEAITWKPFIPLPCDPQKVAPRWTSKGEFDGIDFDGGALPLPIPLPIDATDKGAGNLTKVIPLSHSLWNTNDKMYANGSLWGIPRVTAVYRYWWSYWFRWALYDRFFERKADPPYITYFPTGSGDYTKDDDEQYQSMRAIALGISDAARSGGGIAMPGDTIRGYDDRPTSIREWELFELEVKGDMSHFIESFEYLDVMKLRGIFIPEQAFMEGCLSPDTKVLAPRDKEIYPDGIPLKDIEVGQKIWCINEKTQKFELWPTKSVHKTDSSAEVYKLILDDGSEIIGTPDHRFMKRDGGWVELQNLKEGDSLMPLYESKHKEVNNNLNPENDFEPVIKLDPGLTKYKVEYREIANLLNFDNKNHCHHVDERHCNTALENLQEISPSEHSKLHGNQFWTTAPTEKIEEYKKVYSERTKEQLKNLKESMSAEEYFEFCSARMKKVWENGRVVSFQPRTCKTCEEIFYPDNPRQIYCDLHSPKRIEKYQGRTKNKSNFSVKVCAQCNSEYKPTGTQQKRCANCRENFQYPNYNKERALAPNNHKVRSIEKLEYRTEVWDIIIDGPDYVRNFVAEGVVVHNSGGSSSRNVAGEEINVHKEGTALSSEEIDEHINRYVIPDIVAANFPDFEGEVRKVTTGFTDADNQALATAVQLLGQSDPSFLESLDIEEILDRLGYPQIGRDVLKKREEEAKKALEESFPDEIEPIRGETAGVDKQGLYVQQGDIVTLAEDRTFLDELPPSKHFEDKAIVQNTRKIRKAWNETYIDAYEDFANYISKQNFSETLDLDEADKTAQKLVNKWKFSRAKLNKLIKSSQKSIEDTINRAGTNELKKIRSKDKWSPSKDQVADFLNDRGATYVKAIDETTRTELKVFLANQIREGVDSQQLANRVREHFSETFPEWKADRLALTETRDAYNFATLLAGEQVGVKVVQVFDGQYGPPRSDQECFPGDTYVTALNPEKRLSRRFKGNLVEITTSSGNFLSVTENHPILTGRGWVEAGRLTKSDYVFSSKFSNFSFIFASTSFLPNNNNVHPAIKNPSYFLEVSDSRFTVPQPGTTSDFDSNTGDININIVNVKSFLRYWAESLTDEKVEQIFFANRIESADRLLSYGSFSESFKRFWGSLNGGVSSGNSLGDFLFREPSVIEDSSFGQTPNGDSSFSKGVSNVSGGNIKFSTNFLESFSAFIDSLSFQDIKRLGIILYNYSLASQGFSDFPSADSSNGLDLSHAISGLVERDNIVDLGICEYDGQVYNLQTKENWYLANNIIAHNCIDRNGKFIKIGDALSLALKEHPNGTMEFKLTNKTNLSILDVEQMPDNSDKLALYDNVTETVYFKNDMPLDLQTDYLVQLGKIFESEFNER